MKINTIIAMVGFLLVSVSITATAHNTKPESVDLEINNAGELVAKSNSKCLGGGPPFPEKGCVRAPKGEALQIEFDLKNQPPDINGCTNPAKYELNGIQIGYKNMSKPMVDPWGPSRPMLDNEVLADFLADPVTGETAVTYVGGNKMRVNNNNGSKNGYFVWYRVRASCSDPALGAPDIYNDPRFDNEGNE